MMPESSGVSSCCLMPLGQKAMMSWAPGTTEGSFRTWHCFSSTDSIEMEKPLSGPSETLVLDQSKVGIS